MKTVEIFGCGLFDSSVRFGSLVYSVKRKVENYELEYVVSGDGVSFIDDNRHDFIPGTIIIRKPGQTSYSKLHFKNYFLHFMPDKKGGYGEFLDSCPNFMTSVFPDGYLETFREMQSAYNENGTGKDEILLSGFFRLIYFLKKDKELGAYRQTGKKQSATVAAIIDLIDKNYKSRLTLSDVAAEVGYSPYYVDHFFKKATGLSPNDYLVSRRINASKSDLSDGTKSLSEIAYEYGFSSQSYYSVTFKKIVGLTPNEYRKAIFSQYKL